MAESPEMSDWEEIFHFTERLIGWHPPKAVSVALGILILITLVSVILAALLVAMAKAKSVWIESFLPASYKPEEKGRATARRQFASYLVSEIERLNRTESWRDEEFTELEAEVEATGNRRSRIPFLKRNGIVREHSLSKALEHSTERLVLVKGDPGSGKSVSLRHVVYNIAKRAARSKRIDSVLPVFINLKELKRQPDELINRDLIRNFVINSLQRINDRFVDDFIEREFDESTRSGLWFFLFDSFDEIPDILSSTESDESITAYSNAISDFLGGVNSCRGVLASRAYRGPMAASWTTFNIVELSAIRQRSLIKKSLVARPDLISNIESGIAATTDDVRVMARNPMLLGLLCEHVRLGHHFPNTAFQVFEKYIDYRFARDKNRVLSKFGLSVEVIRRSAEMAAFCMTADSAMGLSPPIGQLIVATRRQQIEIDEQDFRASLKAISYMRLGRLTGAESGNDIEQFTFAHRRFQEYFATRVVMQRERAIDAMQLITDGRWRETAVVLLQTGSAEAAEPLYNASGGFLNMPPFYSRLQQESDHRDDSLFEYPWKRGELHVLGILQAAMSDGANGIPEDLRASIGQLLVEASDNGNLIDKRLSLEVAGVAPSAILIRLMKKALTERSQWLSDAVYQQASKLVDIVPEITSAIRRYIVQMMIDGRAISEYTSTRAYLSRLPESSKLQDYLAVARISSFIDIYLFNFLIVIFFITNVNRSFYIFGALTCYILSSIALRYNSSLMSLSVAFYARLFAIYFGVVGFAPRFESGMKPALWSVASIVLLLYSALLSPSVIFCIRDGGITKKILWPLAPISAAAIILRHFYKLGVPAFPFSWRDGIFIWCFVITVLLAANYIDIEKYTFIFYLFAAAFVGLTSFVACAIILLIAREFIHDFNEIRLKASMLLDNGDFLDIVDSFISMKTMFGRIYLVEAISKLSFDTASDDWGKTFRAMIVHAASQGYFMAPSFVNRRGVNDTNLAYSTANYFDRLTVFLERFAKAITYTFYEQGKALGLKDLLFSLLERATRDQRSIDR